MQMTSKSETTPVPGASHEVLYAMLRLTWPKLQRSVGLPALPGMDVYAVIITETSDFGPQDEEIGLFGSLDAAYTAVKEWVLEQWTHTFQPPWCTDYSDPLNVRSFWDVDDEDEETSEARRLAWLADKSDRDVVEVFFAFARSRGLYDLDIRLRTIE